MVLVVGFISDVDNGNPRDRNNCGPYYKKAEGGIAKRELDIAAVGFCLGWAAAKLIPLLVKLFVAF